MDPFYWIAHSFCLILKLNFPILARCIIESTQDFFRDLQGVELMISIYQDGRNQEDYEIMENALFTLGVAVERNGK